MSSTFTFLCRHPTILPGRYQCCSYFTDEETEAKDVEEFDDFHIACVGRNGFELGILLTFLTITLPLFSSNNEVF